MKPFAVIDIGTNSVRLGVVQPDEDQTYQLLAQQKEVVRLGEGEYANNCLTDEAIERGIVVLAKFARIARSYGAEKIEALATSALREAENQQEFVERAREEADVEVRVISGAEEARLIFLGVASGIELGDQKLLDIDIGGGSTELAAGDRNGPAVLESTKLGAIRVAGIFTDGITGPISDQLYHRIQEYARGVAIRSVKRVQEYGWDLLYGSSGTALNLAEIVARSRGEATTPGQPYSVPLDALEEQAAKLCALTLEQRRKVPGINPERADIIIAGAAVLTSLMKALGATTLLTSERALREGMIVDRMPSLRQQVEGREYSVRERSVLQLARRCQFEEDHARITGALAEDLFDQLKVLGVHSLGSGARELLHYGALLHDVGGFLSYTDHHKHGYYIVRNSPLLGFDTTEICILAALVLHHRKKLPKPKDDSVAGLGRKQREMILILSTLIRLAESMDRGHLAEVVGVRASLEDKGETLVIELLSDQDCQLELWGLQTHANVVKEVFGKRLEVRRSPAEAKSTA